MLLVSTPTKRHFQNNSSLFYILLTFYLFLSFPINADSSPFTYDELLNQVRTKIKAYEYGRALDRLEIARKKIDKPDYRYFYLLGETYFQMGKIIESLDSFEKSQAFCGFHSNYPTQHCATVKLLKILAWIKNDQPISIRDFEASIDL